jgi:hypothetical protein
MTSRDRGATRDAYFQMTDSTETKTATSRMPSHFAYNIRNREGGVSVTRSTS